MLLRSCRFIVLAILLCLLSLTACSPSPSRDPFAYANSAFSLSVEGSYLPANDPDGTPRPFSADISVGQPQGGDGALRDMVVVFTSPASLAGLEVTATLSPSPEGGYVRCVKLSYPSEYGRVEITSTEGELDGFFRFAQGWLPLGDVVEVSPQNANGVYTVTRRRGDREAVFTYKEGLDLPVEVVLTDGWGRVMMTVKSPSRLGAFAFITTSSVARRIRWATPSPQGEGK